jgi:hypothetical protein
MTGPSHRDMILFLEPVVVLAELKRVCAPGGG